ncbi:MAG: hypothetical protein ACE5HE_01475 [Phycisphaerae bacterium]
MSRIMRKLRIGCPERAALTALLSVVIGASAASADITAVTADTWTLESHAFALGGEGDLFDDQVFTSPSLPFNASHTAYAIASSTSTYAFSSSADAASFVFKFDHSSTTEDSIASGAQSNGDLLFTPADDMLYSLTGQYSLTGRETIHMEVSLEEVGGSLLFDNRQESTATPNELFTLGSQDGDVLNLLTGSLSGMLTAGTQYKLHYDYFIGTEVLAPQSARGDLGLSLSSVAVIPVPATALLGVLGFATAGLVRRWIR